MNNENIQHQLDLYRYKYNEEAKRKLLDSMTIKEIDKFFTLLILQQYEHFFLNTVDIETISFIS